MAKQNESAVRIFCTFLFASKISDQNTYLPNLLIVSVTFLSLCFGLKFLLYMAKQNESTVEVLIGIYCYCKSYDVFSEVNFVKKMEFLWNPLENF